jgi:ATP-dependent Clp protease ATP-binding subunit ClpA
MCAHPAAPHPALQERLTARRISLRLSDAALDALTDLGHNPEYGARPLKRVVQRELETPLARALLKQTIADGDTAEFVSDPSTGKLILQVVAAAEQADDAAEATGAEEPVPVE